MGISWLSRRSGDVVTCISEDKAVARHFGSTTYKRNLGVQAALAELKKGTQEVNPDEESLQRLKALRGDATADRPAPNSKPAFRTAQVLSARALPASLILPCAAYVPAMCSRTFGAPWSAAPACAHLGCKE